MSKRTPLLLNYALCFVLAAFFGLVAVFSLRANNLEAVRLRDRVLEVDKNNGDVEKALRELQKYTYAHMHTDLATNTNVYPPIQLKYRYDRLVTAEKQRVEAIMAKVYTDAQAECERQNPTDFSGRNRVPCVEAYVTSHKVAEQRINPDLYKFDFASPVWSPDLAGISLVLAGVFAAMGGFALLLRTWLKDRFI